MNAEETQIEKIRDFYIMFLVCFAPGLWGAMLVIYFEVNPYHWDWVFQIIGLLGIGWTGSLLMTRVMGD